MDEIKERIGTAFVTLQGIRDPICADVEGVLPEFLVAAFDGDMANIDALRKPLEQLSDRLKHLRMGDS